MRIVRVVSLVIATLLMFTLISCKKSGNDNENTLDIVCTIFPQYDIVRSIVGKADDVNITMLIGAGQESHDYDPSSKDISAIHDCDIFIYTGGMSDSWVTDILESVDLENKSVISLFDSIDEPIKHEPVEGMEEDHHDHGAIDHVEYDEHVWTSPKNVISLSDKIFDAICKHKPESKSLFQENLEIFKGELDTIDKNFRGLVNSTDNPIMIIADRFPLAYFCKEYGIKYYAAFSGCAASTEPSSKTVQFLINKVKEENISAVFKMDLSSGNVANTIAAATGSKVLTFYSCHTVGADDFDSGITYVDLMKRNLDSLGQAFNKNKG